MSSTEILLLKGIISELPKEKQDKVMEHYTYIKKYMEESGEEAFFALALVGMELAPK